MSNLTTSVLEWVREYGYWAVLLGSAMDHAGLPTTLVLFAGLAAAGKLSIWLVLLTHLCGGILADTLLYFLGTAAGRQIALRLTDNAKIMGIDSAKIRGMINLLNRHGPGLLIWGRYYILVSRYIPLVCGLGNMPFRTFLCFSVFGLATMTVTFGLSFYYLGQQLNVVMRDPLASAYLTVVIVGLQLVIASLAILRRYLQRLTQRR